MIAGPNGSGKTTLAKHLMSRGISLGEYINPDEIADQLTGARDERTREAQQIADSKRNRCIQERRSFTFETVMSHPSKIEVLARAKDAGFQIFFYFIGTDDPETNVERVALRVLTGGHSVPEDKIRKRWLRTMLLLHEAVKASDKSYVFDNSAAGVVDNIPRLVFQRTVIEAGRLPQSEMIGAPPNWLQEFLLNPLELNFFESYSTVRHKTTVGSIVTLPLQAKSETDLAPASTVDSDVPNTARENSAGLGRFSNALFDAVDTAANAYLNLGSGLRTGFRLLDRLTGGLQKSELIVLASHPGMGKTAIATNIAYTIAKQRSEKSDDTQPIQAGGSVGFFSLEMSAEQIATRIISQQSGIPASTIRRGQITESEFALIRDLAIEFQNLPIFIDETTVISIDQVIARARRLRQDRGLDLLVIDNLNLLRSVARNNFGETHRASLEITQKLKMLAKELNIPVLALAQLPAKVQKGRDRKPRLSDFDDGGLVEQDADLIMFLHREDYYLQKEQPSFGSYAEEAWRVEMEQVYGVAEIIIAKQRIGATGTVNLTFDASTGSFADWPA
jgi:replicative DNA helicase